MPLKLQGFQSPDELAARNASDLQGFAQEGNLTAYLPLLTVLAEALDMAVRGTDLYLTLGTTMRSDALVLRLIVGGEKTPVYAATLVELAAKAEVLIDASVAPSKALETSDPMADSRMTHNAPQRGPQKRTEGNGSRS